MVIAFFFTLNQWAAQPPAVSFQRLSVRLGLGDGRAWIDPGWWLDCLILRRPEGWGIGLGFLLVNLVGHGVAIRLAEPQR